MKEDFRGRLTPDSKHRCQNCAMIWSPKQLMPIADLWERIDPGEPLPSGECPDHDCCGALCHPYDDVLPVEEWTPWRESFDYEKAFYDVRLRDGTIIEHCWPNAGTLTDTDPDGKEGRVFKEIDEVYVRLSKTHPLDEPEKEQEFDVEMCRVSYATKTIRVTAKSRLEAEELAMEKAGDIVFSESSANYEVQDINEVKKS